MVFTAKGRHLHHEVVTFGGTKIERIGRDCNTKSFKFLGHWIDDSLNWNDHFQKLATKLNSYNYALAKIKKTLPFHARKSVYLSLVQSHLSWGSVIFGSTNPSNISKIEGIQNKVVRNLCDVSITPIALHSMIHFRY